MVKLYYTPTSCGAANFIAANVAGVKLDAEQVNLGTHTTITSNTDYYKINPKGNVPAIILDDGTVLNENSATLQYIADQAKTTKVGAANGTTERYLLQVALSYISSELHASVGPLFNPSITEEIAKFFRARITTKLDYIEKSLLGKKNYLVGDSFTVADSYLFIVFSWFEFLKIDLSPYHNITAYVKRVSELPAVQAARAKLAENPASTV